MFSKKPGSPGGGNSSGKDFSFKVGPFSYNNNKGFTDRSAARNSAEEDPPRLDTRDRNKGKGKIPSASNLSHFNLFLIQKTKLVD